MTRAGTREGLEENSMQRASLIPLASAIVALAAGACSQPGAADVAAAITCP